MRAAVLGAGPAGFYAAQALLRRFPNANVDIIERLPVPFGLVRYGVAPDHPATKNVTASFSAFMDANPSRVRFLGNVPALQAPGLSLEDFERMYNLTILATGAAKARTLTNIDLPSSGTYLAHDLVFWMNGHPEMHSRQEIAKDMSNLLKNAHDVAVVGLGNVAIDVARLLLRPVEDLRSTDMSPAALDAISSSRIDRVTLIGRRSPRYASWTTAALREIVAKIPSIHTFTDHSLLLADAAMHDLSRSTKRTLKLLLDKTNDMTAHMQKPMPKTEIGGSKAKQFHLEFLHEPATIMRKNNSTELTLHENEIINSVGDATTSAGQAKVRRTGRKVLKSTDLLFLSLGYEGGAGVGTRVGWANGKGKGIIGDSKWDAETIIRELPSKTTSHLMKSEGIDNWAKKADCDIVSWAGWQRIDAEERARGAAIGGGRERVKLESTQEMLAVARGSSPVGVICSPVISDVRG